MIYICSSIPKILLQKILENILEIAYYTYDAIINSIYTHKKGGEMMKAKVVKKVMAVALTVTLTVAPSLGVMASGNSGNQPSQGSTSSSSNKTKEEAVIEAVNESLAAAQESGDGGASSISSIAQIPTTSTVAGVQTTVAGVYLATSINGCAITTGVSSISAGYGLTAGEKPYARFYNLEEKRSPLAKAAIDNAAVSLNAEVGPYVNIELGKLAGGKYSLLSSDGAEIEIKLGVPKSFVQDGKTFAMICVRPGGAVSVLKDIDENPNTITFNTTGGQGAYAMIRYN